MSDAEMIKQLRDVLESGLERKRNEQNMVIMLHSLYSLIQRLGGEVIVSIDEAHMAEFSGMSVEIDHEAHTVTLGVMTNDEVESLTAQHH